MSVGTPSTKSSSREPEPKGTGLGGLARRITGRTTDLIAIGVVLIGGLAMGRQLVDWWNAADPLISAQAQDPTGGLLSDPAAAVRLRFGDAPLSMSREVIAGDREAALKRLSDQCAEVARTAGLPEKAPDPGEIDLLAATEGRSPAVEQPGTWCVYRLEDRLSVVVGVKSFAAGADATSRRVVSFGFALPLDTEEWALYSFSDSKARSGSADEMPEIDLPPGARRSLALAGDRGNGVIGFGGAGDAAAWRKHIESALGAQGWLPADSWRTGPDGASATFIRRDRPGAAVAVHLAGDAQSQLSGLILLFPERPPPNVQTKGSSQ